MPRKKAASTTPRRRATRRPAAQTRAATNVWSPVASFGFGTISPSDVGTTEAIRVSSILAVVRWIAQAVAVMPVQVLRTLPDGRKQDADLPCGYTLRKRPNSWQSAYDLYQLVAYWTALHGNAFARVMPGPRGFCSELRPMHPSRVNVVRNRDYTVSYQFWNDSGSWETLREPVIHWRWLSDNGLVGMAPAELCSTSIALARQLDIAAQSFWQNSARPDMVMELQERIPDEAMAALRAQLREIYGGPKNRGAVAVLPKKTQLKPIESNSMEANQFQELRDAILPDVARAWGVPSTLVGDHRMARWSNVEQEHLSAQIWTLLPWARRMEGPLDMLLQPVYGEDVYVRLDNRGILRADTAARVQLYQALFNMGALKPQELRELEDLPPLEDPAADETYMQLGFSTLGNAAAAVEAAPPEPAAAAPGADDIPQRSIACRCGTRNCGTGAGGFQSGNTCGKGGGAGGGAGGGGVGGGDAGAGEGGGGDGYAVGGSPGGSGDAGSSGPDDSPTPKQKQRKERLRDRIEGTQAEADREVKKAEKKLSDLKKKEAEIKTKLEALKDPQGQAQKVFDQGLAKARAEKEAKIAAAKAKFDAKMKAIREKYGPRDGDGDGILNEGDKK